MLTIPNIDRRICIYTGLGGTSDQIATDPTQLKAYSKILNDDVNFNQKFERLVSAGKILIVNPISDQEKLRKFLDQL